MAPSRSPTPVRIGTTTILFAVNSGHSETADKIGRAVDADEALVDRLRGRQAVDQHHGTRALAAEIEAKRWALPEHLQIAGIFGVEPAFAIADADPERAAGLLPKHITVWQTPKAARFLYDFGKTARNRAEEAMAGVDDFNGGILIGLRLRVGVLSRRVGWCLVGLGRQRARSHNWRDRGREQRSARGHASSAPLGLAPRGCVDMKLLTFA